MARRSIYIIEWEGPGSWMRELSAGGQGDSADLLSAGSLDSAMMSSCSVLMMDDYPRNLFPQCPCHSQVYASATPEKSVTPQKQAP